MCGDNIILIVKLFILITKITPFFNMSRQTNKMM